MTETQHIPPDPLDSRLSPAGRTRAQEMHSVLLSQVDRRRRHRHAVQIGSGVAALGALFVVVTASRAPSTPPAPVPVARTAPTTIVPRRASPAIVILAPDPTALARLSISPTTPTLVRNLTDDQLINAFRADGLSIALVRINGRLHLAAN